MARARAADQWCAQLSIHFSYLYLKVLSTRVVHHHIKKKAGFQKKKKASHHFTGLRRRAGKKIK